MYRILLIIIKSSVSAFALVASDIDPEPALLDLGVIVSMVVVILVALYKYKTLNNIIR